MPYLSPLSLLQEKLPDLPLPTDKSGLTLAKKALLAEVDLSETKTLVHSQGEMTKDDLLRYFDDLANSDNFTWHLAIARDPALSAFLAYWQLPSKNFVSSPVYQDPDFRHFITPFFVEAYSGLFRDAFRYSEQRTADALLNMELLWDSSGPASFAYSVRTFLTEMDREIDDLTEKIRSGGYYRFTEIEKLLFSPVQLRLLNALPPEARPGVDFHVRILIDYSYAFYDIGDNKTALAIIRRLMAVKTEPDTHLILKERIDLYANYVSPISPKGRKITENPGETSTGGLSAWQWIWIIIMVFNVLRHCL